MADKSSNQNDAVSKGKSKLELVQLTVGIFLSIVTGFSAWKLNQADTSLKKVENTLQVRESNRKDSEEIRAERESNEKKQLQVYDAVVKSLESGDAKRQAVSKALVTSLLEDPLRTELLSVLTTSSSPEIRKEAQATLALEGTFKSEEKALQQPAKKTSTNWEDWDFDIFWCEHSGDSAKLQAEKIVTQLQQEGAKGRLRVRLLPDSINARSGYQHTGYVIRFNTGEKEQAIKLKDLGDKILGLNPSFTISLSTQSTPWYLSAFVCPANL